MANTNDNDHIGYLSNGNEFRCIPCAEQHGDTHCKVFRVNIGIYSQTCCQCKKLVIDGVKKSLPPHGPLNLFDGGLN
jgi:hypothetical protein